MLLCLLQGPSEGHEWHRRHDQREQQGVRASDESVPKAFHTRSGPKPPVLKRSVATIELLMLIRLMDRLPDGICVNCEQLVDWPAETIGFILLIH